MKFIFVVVALSCLSLIVAKPIDDVERKCIVKYLSEKELLDSSFVVDPVLPDNCDELISAKIFEIYFDIIYDGKKPEEDDWSYVEHIFRRNGVADVVLKSLLYHEDSNEAKDLKETVEIMKPIKVMLNSFEQEHYLNTNVKALKIKKPDSDTELCMKHYFTSEILSNYITNETIFKLEKYDIKDLECDEWCIHTILGNWTGELQRQLVNGGRQRHNHRRLHKPLAHQL